MGLDHKLFYDRYRRYIGKLTQVQVNHLNKILPEIEKSLNKGITISQMAYIMATVRHETANTYRPLREYGRGRGRRYGRPTGPYGHVYYGRGFVQLTWMYNYKAQGNRMGVDLVKDPDLALRHDIAWDVLVTGMMNGSYNGRGHGLPYYINDNKKDYIRARRTVNVMDKAYRIARKAEAFEEILKESYI